MPERASGPPPQVSERYEIKEAPIGRGGMGVVYKAYDNKTRRFVALKTISGEVEPGALELFEREWNVLARISHPNIVDILDTGDYPENGHRKPYFVMPLLPGVTLEHLIKTSSQRLTVERIVEIMCQACRGLHAAHEQGLVHRDVKPSNIFVMDDDAVKIIDFGVVHLADTRTVTGLKGTPLYMSPEQIDGKTATALSDIFALGVVCYEALTGRKPFSRRNEGEMFEAIRSHIPPPASDINPAVNLPMSRTVHKAMAKQPWHRFSTAKEFADTLQKALRNEPIERFDRAKIQPRIERIKKAYAEGDYQFAGEILTELESEGHMDPEMSILRLQLDQAVRTKTIRQLLDSARTRMEEDEYPLALQKLQDVLVLDPSNVDATTLRRQIERERSEKQTEGWFRLAVQHLDNQDYRQARQALEEILKIDSSDTRARELLSRLERTEQEDAKAREEKQKLYDAALNSYRNGEISTALSKLERLLEINRSGPKSTAPDREQQYQSLYNQIRSEREAARNSYAEGRKYLADRNFTKALEICTQYLDKHTGDPLFQALKIEAEEVQRQEQSAALAEIGRRVESEHDLDKKYSIVSDAVERYPSETQFKSQLKSVKDRRDLVNSIVSRARQYEERAQFNDAAAQWDILRNIYPSYPGLDFEMQRLARRREEQVAEDAKARWVERIDRHIEAAEYIKAREAIKQALTEFPNDQELRGLDALAEQALKRNTEAAALLQQGQNLIAANRFEDGIKILRKAERLDERNPAARAALLGALLQRARDLMSSDWHSAEPLVDEVLKLEPSDPVARSLHSLISDYKRQEAVSRFLLEARNLQAAGNLEAALATVERGLEAFPNESRLLQLQHTLRGGIPDKRKESVPPPPTPVELVNDAEFAATVLLERAAPAPAPAPKPSRIAQLGAISSATAAPPAPPPPPVIQVPESTPPTPPPNVKKTSAAPVVEAPDKKRATLIFGAAGVAAVLILAAILFAFFKKKTPTPLPTPSVSQVAVTFAANAPGVRYLLDGKAVSGGTIKLDPGSSHHAEAEADGYISDARSFTVPSASSKPMNVAFNLQPAAPELRINSDLGAGKLVLDQNAPIDLQDGSLTKDDLPPGAHQVAILDSGKRQVFGFGFEVKPREVAALTAPPKGTAPGVIVSSLGSNAVVYATANLKGGIEGQPVQVIPPEGLKLTLPSQGAVHFAIDDGHGKTRLVALEYSPLPAIAVSLGAAVEKVPVTLTANVPDAIVVLNGHDLKPLVSGKRVIWLPEGKYHVSVKAEDYEPAEDQVVEVKAGQAPPKPLEFTLKPIAHMATVVIESAPPDTEVLIDGTSAGVISSGSFKKEVTPTHHTIVLKKPNYVDYTKHQQFAAGQTLTISGSEMEPYGKLTLKVSPDKARIVYRRNGSDQDVVAQNNQDVPLPPGTYTVTASQEGYTSQSQTIDILSGKEAPFAVTLPKPVVVSPTQPGDIFENPRAWTFTNVDSWWTYAQKGISFTRRNEGTLTFTLLKDPRLYLKEKIKKYEFVADYKDDDNKILYTLDQHKLTKKVFVDGKERKEARSEASISAGDSYRMSVQITPENVTVRINGAADTTKRPETRGKFGFVNEVVLAPR